MCGIVGFVDPRGFGSKESVREILLKMVRALSHRGPDDEGIWLEPEGLIAIGHRRLAVIDPSPQGRQPMESANGRYVISLNGEIYNFRQLAGELEQEGLAPKWRGHSDTEVFLATVEARGLKEALKRSVGMFAFAVFDRSKKTLYLARDRMGEKPLYYGWARGIFLFASELKALRAHPKFHGEIDPEAVALFLRHNYIPSPWSIYKNVRKVPPGSFLTIPVMEASKFSSTRLHPERYWDPMDVALKGQRDPFRGSERDAIDHLERLLTDSVEGQMISDVPLGAFLSGGIDSSTVVALMQAISKKPIRTFTVGFPIWDYDEAPHARKVAEHLGTDHTEIYVDPQKALDVIPELPTVYDEPFSDSSQIPTHLIASVARQHVTVALSGDGGDELFGGYPRYFQALKIWRRVNWMPSSLRLALARVLKSRSASAWDRLLGWATPFVLGKKHSPSLGDKLLKMADILDFSSMQHMYRDFISHWRPVHGILPLEKSREVPLDGEERWPHLSHPFQRMMFWDMVTYLPDDILVKVDRAAMAVSLETRMPLLDHRIVEFSWTLPLSMKIKNSKGKWILRQVLHRHVPRELVERPKMGFGIPLGQWLRGPLRSWAEELLNEDEMRQRGLVRPEPVLRKWREHLSGSRNWHYLLWDVLMLQAWLKRWHP